jgi:hypothetical protein
MYIVRVTDEDENVAFDTLLVKVLNDKPDITVLCDHRSLNEGGGYAIHGQTKDLGRVAWEWDIGGTGTYVRSDSGVRFHPKFTDGKTVMVRARASDEDGNVSAVEAEFPVNVWEFYNLVKPGGETNDWWWTWRQIVPLQGKLGFTGTSCETCPDGNGLFYTYDPVRDTLEKMPGPPQNHRSGALGSTGNLAMLMGAYPTWADGTNVNAHAADIFDPQLHLWYSVADIPAYMDESFSDQHYSAYAAGRFQLIYPGSRSSSSHTNGRIAEYDVGANAWGKSLILPPDPDGSGYYIHSVSGFADKFYFIIEKLSNGPMSSSNPISLWQYDPIMKTWELLSTPGTVTSFGFPTLVAIDGNLFIMSGKRTLIFDLILKTYRDGPDFEKDFTQNSATVMDGKIYSLVSGKIYVLDPADWR